MQSDRRIAHQRTDVLTFSFRNRSGVCDVFMSGFWYINMLAGTASVGGKGVFRQTLSGGHYGLLDQTDAFRPRPDFWTALLFQRLASTTWLYIHQCEPGGDPGFAEHVRVYLTCAHPKAATPGAVTLIYSNTHATQPFWLRGISFENWVGDFSNVPTAREEYILTAPGAAFPCSLRPFMTLHSALFSSAFPDLIRSAMQWDSSVRRMPGLIDFAGNNISSPIVLLNGKPLQTDADGMLPHISGKVCPVSLHPLMGPESPGASSPCFDLPALSIGHWPGWW